MKKYLKEELKEKMELWTKWIFYGSIYREYEMIKTESTMEYKEILKHKEQLATILLEPNNPYSKVIRILFQ